ncbi:hypothetical protein M8J75_011197 [Diaphorina citri]|nr:hypothetical protein M8J75_011197 [Diaphorina citri]
MTEMIVSKFLSPQNDSTCNSLCVDVGFSKVTHGDGPSRQPFKKTLTNTKINKFNGPGLVNVNTITQ